MTITFFSTVAGLPPAKAKVRIVWAHGWGQTHAGLAPMAEALSTQATHLLLDFPGFGKSPAPEKAWTVDNYADAAAKLFLRKPFRGPTIWVGHSFGCRVGMVLAARHPGKLQGLFLIAAPGLPPKRSLFARAKLATKVRVFKTLKRLYGLTGGNVETLRARFGSADYKSAGALRKTFLNVVGQNLSSAARKVACPTLLVYGSRDTETPPDIGTRLEALIPQSRLEILPGQDHYTVIGAARHQTLAKLSAFLKSVAA